MFALVALFHFATYFVHTNSWNDVPILSKCYSRNQKYMIGLDSYSRQVFNYLDPILIYISLWIDCLFEIRKIAVCFLWLSLPGHYRVTDEALLAETT